MAAENFFSHEGDGTPATRAANAGYMAGARAWGIGENPRMGNGQGRHTTPRRSRLDEEPRASLGDSHPAVPAGGDRIADGSPIAGIDLGAQTFTAVFGFRKG